MTKDIDFNGRIVTFTSNGATPLFYRQFFKKDIIKEMSGDNPFSAATENAPELGFIMAKQAEGADMMKLTQTDYIEWLSSFGALDLTVHAMDVIEVYVDDSIPSEEPKKKVSEEPNE